MARKVDDNGRILQTRFFASSTSRELVELAPFGPSDEVREGDSGSSLYAGDQLVGMIISVDTESRQAVALTQSQIHGLFGADVLPGARRTALVRPFKYRQTENAYATVAASEYLTQTANMQLNAPAADGSVPARTDYVFSGAIVDISSTRSRESALQTAAARERVGQPRHSNCFGSSSAASRPRWTTRSIAIRKADICASITSTSRWKSTPSRATARVVNLERRSYELPESTATAADLEKTAVSTAVKDALALTFDKYLK